MGLDQVLGHWSAVAPQAVFLGVHQLPPAHYAVLERGSLHTACYWVNDFPARGAEPGQDIRQNAAELRERVVQASRLRFQRSDVPVSTYLSGGIDSSVTAAVLNQYTSASLSIFSLRFADTEFDETAHQPERTALGHSWPILWKAGSPSSTPGVISFVNSLPARHKFFGLDEKHLLKLAFADLVPESILHRP